MLRYRITGKCDRPCSLLRRPHCDPRRVFSTSRGAWDPSKGARRKRGFKEERIQDDIREVLSDRVRRHSKSVVASCPTTFGKCHGIRSDDIQLRADLQFLRYERIPLEFLTTFLLCRSISSDDILKVLSHQPQRHSEIVVASAPTTFR